MKALNLNSLCWMCLCFMFFVTNKAQAQVTVFPVASNSVNIKNANAINTGDLEFSPTFYQNGIVYVSSQTQKSKVDKKIGEHFFTLWYAEFGPDGMPISPQPFSATVTSQVHEGPVSFGSNQEVIYFTRNTKDLARLEIYDAEKGSADWENEEILPFCNKAYSVCHPSISKDNKTLYFASNMPGGFGGMDIYKVELDNSGKWGKPENLGQSVNSNKNESFPVIHSSGQLFFASDGRGGYGGYDIYVVDTKEKLLEPKNMREPFNSNEDDLGFALSDDMGSGFFTSSRAGGAGKDDIYYFTLNEVSTGNSTITVIDKNSQTPVNGAEIRIFERSADGFISGSDLYEVVMEPAKDDSKDLNLRLVRKNEKELGAPNALSDGSGSANLSVKPERQYLVLVSKMGYESSEMVYNTIGKNAPFNIRVELDKKQQCVDYSTMIKDSKSGSPISGALVTIKNSCNGKDVSLRSDANGKVNYCMPANCRYDISIGKDGYGTAASMVDLKGSKVSSSPMTQEFSLSSTGETILQKGSVIIIEKIYYDFNQSEIRKGAARELDALVELMKQYPEMEVLMTSHTDSRGNDKYNQQLSEKRAASAKKYLVARGIKADRITTAGAGESSLRNQCSDGTECNEEEHQYNRRTEVKVTKVNSGLDIEYIENAPEVVNGKKKNN